MSSDGLLKIKSALISVSDRNKLDQFSNLLKSFGVKIYATSGTAKSLETNGVNVQSIEKITHYPQMLSGRVKTLQPEIFSAILAKKEASQLAELEKYNIEPFDMVVCNFYPFHKISLKEDVSEDELIETIDIGGPSMVRAAAKNFNYIAVVPSADFYSIVSEELRKNDGSISFTMRKKLALEALRIVTFYDITIYNTLFKRIGNFKEGFPEHFFVSASKYEKPKYGENPEQEAMIYTIDGYETMATWTQLSGDVRSYNNYLDIGSSYEILEGFEDHPTAATVKHGHISGFAFADSLVEAYSLAHSCDPEADFGCTTVLNRTVDVETSRLIGKNEGKEDGSVYTEIVVAPGYENGALEILKRKQRKKIRVIIANNKVNYPYDIKVVQGLLLVQKRQDYSQKLVSRDVEVVSETKPTMGEIEKMLGLWEVVRKVESNGIVVGDGVFEDGGLKKLWTYGVGSFRKRNGAVRIALENAGNRSKGAFAASDGFFPFRDSIDILGEAGVKGVIQPGGSINDKSIVEAANEYGMVMVLTHKRAFKH
jgi:phosphoribosylaminoimidazolecarboxamide formyltransferase/IMP cyclohydrolase